MGDTIDTAIQWIYIKDCKVGTYLWVILSIRLFSGYILKKVTGKRFQNIFKTNPKGKMNK